jgi:hypothetical protein
VSIGALKNSGATHYIFPEPNGYVFGNAFAAAFSGFHGKMFVE